MSKREIIHAKGRAIQIYTHDFKTVEFDGFRIWKVIKQL